MIFQIYFSNFVEFGNYGIKKINRFPKPRKRNSLPISFLFVTTGEWISKWIYERKPREEVGSWKKQVGDAFVLAGNP